ncbi:hypothetical protein C8Q73DRAFT_533717 [Cubamyces lactineus]|nr:hypothetical protein C8Q73DRAFT_533717 [Cubamyces lactineus]
MSRTLDDSQLLSTPSLGQPVEASAPFNQSSADIILRTSDHVLFRVHSQILAQASPLFADMFELPQPGRSSSGPPIICISEDGETLDLLLRLLYPIPKKQLQMNSPERLVPALKAAQKYEMGLPLEAMSERLTAIVPREPLQVWAAACRSGLEDIAYQAAVVLRKPAQSLTNQAATSQQGTVKEALTMMDSLGDMNGISAADYLRLKRFLRAPQQQVDGGGLKLLSSLPSEGNPSSISQTPFSTDLPQTDVLCRSTHPADAPQTLLAHQAILSVHSQVLRARITSLRTDDSNGQTSGTLVLDFDDDPDIVSALMLACYEGFSGLPTRLDALGRLLLAAQKYKMPQVEQMVHLAWEKLAGENPLEAFYVAVNHGLKEQAKTSAKAAYRHRALDTYLAEMERTPALAYHRLLTYHDSCLQVIRERAATASNKIPAHANLCTAQHSTFLNRGASVDTTTMRTAVMSADVVAGPTEPFSLSIKRAFQQTLRTSIATYSNSYVAQGFRDLTYNVIELLGDLPEEIERAVNDVEVKLP